MSQIIKKWIGDHQVDSTKVDPSDNYVLNSVKTNTIGIGTTNGKASAADPLFISSGTTAALRLESSALGTGHSYQLNSDAFGRFNIYDVTNGLSPLSISSVGVVTMPNINISHADMSSLSVSGDSTVGTLRVQGNSTLLGSANISGDVTSSTVTTNHETINQLSSIPGLQINHGGVNLTIDASGINAHSATLTLVATGGDVRIQPSSGKTYIIGDASVTGTVAGGISLTSLDVPGYLRVGAGLTPSFPNPPSTLTGNIFVGTNGGSGVMFTGSSVPGTTQNYISAQYDTVHSQAGFLTLQSSSLSLSLENTIARVSASDSVNGVGIAIENLFGGNPGKWSITAGPGHVLHVIDTISSVERFTIQSGGLVLIPDLQVGISSSSTMNVYAPLHAYSTATFDDTVNLNGIVNTSAAVNIGVGSSSLMSVLSTLHVYSNSAFDGIVDHNGVANFNSTANLFSTVNTSAAVNIGVGSSSLMSVLSTLHVYSNSAFDGIVDHNGVANFNSTANLYSTVNTSAAVNIGVGSSSLMSVNSTLHVYSQAAFDGIVNFNGIANLYSTVNTSAAVNIGVGSSSLMSINSSLHAYSTATFDGTINLNGTVNTSAAVNIGIGSSSLMTVNSSIHAYSTATFDGTINLNGPVNTSAAVNIGIGSSSLMSVNSTLHVYSQAAFDGITHLNGTVYVGASSSTTMEVTANANFYSNISANGHIGITTSFIAGGKTWSFANGILYNVI